MRTLIRIIQFFVVMILALFGLILAWSLIAELLCTPDKSITLPVAEAIVKQINTRKYIEDMKDIKELPYRLQDCRPKNIRNEYEICKKGICTTMDFDEFKEVSIDDKPYIRKEFEFKQTCDFYAGLLGKKYWVKLWYIGNYAGDLYLNVKNSSRVFISIGTDGGTYDWFDADIDKERDNPPKIWVRNRATYYGRGFCRILGPLSQ